MKTIPSSSSVIDFLASLDNADQRKDSETLIDIMSNVSGESPVMWGPSIIGFGSYHYKHDSGREGDMPNIAFSPRKGKLVLYITYDAEKYVDIRQRLGAHKVSKACIYISKLSDVSIDTLKELVTVAYSDNKKAQS